jgi:putative PIN family toxin of toxin-antitoxin system
VRIVLDTNVLVSAFLKPGSKPAQVLDRILAGEVTVLVDARILVEYHEVLSRPKFDLPDGPRNEVLEYLSREGENVIAEPLSEGGPDADDLPFLEAAVAGSAEALVTGNKKHFQGAGRLDVRVLSPTEFLRWLEARSG